MKLSGYCDLCGMSYDPEAKGFENVEDLRYGIFRYPDETVVSIRGSANVSNWIRDFLVIPGRTFDGRWIHGGVAKGVMLLLPRIAKELTKKDLKNLKVIGHSLGGGIAREISRYFKSIGYSSEAISFGALRTDLCHGKIPVAVHQRVICDDDPVPMIPNFFYVQDCVPLINLKDGDDEIVNPKDHNWMIYSKRLKSLNL